MKKRVQRYLQKHRENTANPNGSSVLAYNRFHYLSPFWDHFATHVAPVRHFLKVFAACAVLASILLPLDALWRRSWLSWAPFWLLPGSLLATMSAPTPPLWVP